jgi:serine phosphatase RsbU (regulator of sigma subunit)
MSLHRRLLLGFTLTLALVLPLSLALDYRFATQASREWMRQQSAYVAELLEEKLMKPLNEVAAQSARQGHSGRWEAARLDLDSDHALSWVEDTGRRVTVPLRTLQSKLEDVPRNGPGYIFLLDRTGTLLALPSDGRWSSQRLSPDTLDPALLSPRSESALLRLNDPLSGQPADVVLLSMPQYGLTVGVLRPEQEVVERLRPLLWRLLQLALLWGGLVWLLCYALARRITRPLEQLAEEVGLIVEGAPDRELISSDITEVAQLSTAFARLRADLASYLEQLTRQATEKASLAKELEVARAIQGNADLSIQVGPWLARGQSQPAREVGGDFMDAFPLADGRLAVLVGDVSGKGIPAALHTLLARSGLKLGLLESGSPAQALQQANRLLCLDNPDAVFVSALVAVLDPERATLLWARAGHPAPLTAQGPLSGPTAPPLGLLATVVFQETVSALTGASRLLLYTDGFPEAENELGEFLNLPPLQQALATGEDLWRLLERHRGRAEPSDDATCVLLSRP